MDLEIEKWFLTDDIGKIGIASIVSAVVAVMMITPDYQIFKIVEGDFWLNILRLIGNAAIIVVIVLTLIEIVLRLIRLISSKDEPQQNPPY